MTRLDLRNKTGQALQASFGNKGSGWEAGGSDDKDFATLFSLLGSHFKTIGHTFQKCDKVVFVLFSKAETFLLNLAFFMALMTIQ